MSIYEVWLINNLCLWAIYASFKPGMIFGDLGDEIEEKLGEYWSKPVIACPVCMPTIWAIPVYFILLPAPWYFFIIYHLTMVGSNYIVSQLISKHIEVTLEDDQATPRVGWEKAFSKMTDEEKNLNE